MKKKIIIAIDGHSSTGKSTLAKMLSKHLKYKHINTGAMYRAVTLNAIKNNWINDNVGLESFDKNKIFKSVDSLLFDFVLTKSHSYEIYLNNKSVETEIKMPLVSKYVSIISAYPLIREKIVKIQQEIGRQKGIVMEGRDIGSVVFPNAELKLFITASLEIRAKRRYQELLSIGVKSKFKDVLENLEMRDFSDSTRKTSPLVQVQDAVLVDNTFLTIDQQFNLVIDLLKQKTNLS